MALGALRQAGATLVDNFRIRGNRLGLEWDANRGGEGPATGGFGRAVHPALRMHLLPPRCCRPGRCSDHLPLPLPHLQVTGTWAGGGRTFGAAWRRCVRASTRIWPPATPAAAALWPTCTGAWVAPCSLQLAARTWGRRPCWWRGVVQQRERQWCSRAAALLSCSWACCLTFRRSGEYHPDVGDEVLAALQATYAPADYPTPAMRALGMVCGCGSDLWRDPCRAEFRQASMPLGGGQWTGSRRGRW